MIRTAIVDDEIKSREVLSTLLKRYCNGVSVDAFAGNVAEASQVIKNINPELLFLDIAMPDGSGFDLLSQCQPNNFEVIFTTAYNEYAMQAIKAKALDYLLKPINIVELQKAVQKAEQRINEKKSLNQLRLINAQNGLGKIAIPVINGLQFISIQDIIRLTAKGSYTQIFCENNTSVLSSRPLKDYEDLLPNNRFFRAHHSHIINLAFVKQYHRGEGGYVTMIDGSSIDIAKRKKKEFLELFSI